MAESSQPVLAGAAQLLWAEEAAQRQPQGEAVEAPSPSQAAMGAVEAPLSEVEEQSGQRQSGAAVGETPSPSPGVAVAKEAPAAEVKPQPAPL